MNNPIIREAVTLVTAAQSRSLAVRMIGSTAIAYLADCKIEERPKPIKDIDFIALSRQRKSVQEWLESRSWSIDTSLLYSENRETFTSSEQDCTVDLFYDAVEGSHRILLADRLGESFPTISWDDLLLTKLQRHSLRTVDMWDVATLLSTPPAEDLSHFECVLGSDWGLYTTVTDNLNLLLRVIPNINTTIVVQLIDAANRSTRSLRWKARSLVGRRMKWWQEVYDATIPSRRTIPPSD